jgi:ABC-type uncharacterized transport system involved in gliding motility auxiliary subunit
MTTNDETVRAPVASPARGRRADTVTLSWGSVGLLLLALVLCNAALGRARLRVDLTEDGLYTLSPSSRKVVGSLTDPAQVRVYWGPKVPSKQAFVKRRVEGLLAEFEAASDGHLAVTWVDMEGDAGKKEAGERGLQEITFQQFGASDVSATKDYQGIWIQYEGKTSVISPLSQGDRDQMWEMAPDLEYQLTSSIWSMSRKTKAVVGVVKESPSPFMGMHGGGRDRFTVLAGEQVLGRVYGDSLKSWLSLEDAVPEDVTVLVVCAPREWSEKKVFHLEQFLLRGGKVLLLLDSVDLDAFQGRPAVKSGLEDWLKAQGIDLPEGVLADFMPEAMGALFSRGEYFPYPFFVNLSAENMAQGVPALQGLRRVMTFWPSEVLVDEAKQKAEGRRYTALATTTERGWRKPDTFGLDRRGGDDATGKSLGKHVVVAMVEGKFTSNWKGKPSPDEPPPPPPKPPEPGPGEAGMDAAMGEPTPGMEGGPAMEGEAAMGAEPAMEPAMEEPAMAPEPGMEPAMEEPAMEAGMEPPPSGPKGPEGEAGEKAPAAKKRLDEGSGVLVVVGDAGLVADESTGGLLFLNGQGTGFVLVGNLVDWLTGDEDVLALRARTSGGRKMAEVGEDKAGQIRAANFLAAPVLMVLVGLVVFFVRRNRR